MSQQGNPRGCLRVEAWVYNNWYWEAGRLNEIGRYRCEEDEDSAGVDLERMMLV